MEQLTRRQQNDPHSSAAPGPGTLDVGVKATGAFYRPRPSSKATKRRPGWRRADADKRSTSWYWDIIVKRNNFIIAFNTSTNNNNQQQQRLYCKSTAIAILSSSVHEIALS